VDIAGGVMTYTVKQNWGGLSLDMTVYDADGVACYLVRAQGFRFFRPEYLFCDKEGRTLLSMVQNRSLIKTTFSIHEDGVRVGSAGSNLLNSRGLIDIEGVGRSELVFGWGFRTSFSLTGADGVVAEVRQKRMAWAIDVRRSCDTLRLLAGMAIVYSIYMDRG
jgi:uncharacterized protein YxjI